MLVMFCGRILVSVDSRLAEISSAPTLDDELRAIPALRATFHVQRDVTSGLRQKIHRSRVTVILVSQALTREVYIQPVR